MNNKFLHLPEDMPAQARNAFLVGLSNLFGLTIFTIALIIFAVSTGVWQFYADASVAGACLIISLFGQVMIRRGRLGLGTWLAVYILFPTIIINSLLLSGLGLTTGIIIAALTAVNAPQALPKSKVTGAIVAGVITGILILLIDTFSLSLFTRFPAPNAYIVFTIIGAFLSTAPVVFITVRQIRHYSLRTKLLASVIALTVLSVGILAFVNYNNTRANLTRSAGDGLKSLANSQAAAISNILIQEVQVLQSFDLSKVVQDRVDVVNASYGSDDVTNLQQIKSIERQWQAAFTANNQNAAVITPITNSEVASELTEFKDTFSENKDVLVTDKYGALVATTDLTPHYYQANEDWWQAAYNNGKGAVYFGQPVFNPTQKKFEIILAVPLVAHGTNEVTGVVRSTINLDEVIAVLNAPLLNNTAHTDLYLPGNQVLAPEDTQVLRPSDPEALAHLGALISDTTYASFTLDGEPSVVSAASVSSTNPEVQTAIKNLGWTLIVDQSQADNLAPVSQQTRVNVLIALLILAVAAVISIFLAQSLTNPIVRLTAVASEIAGGNLSAQASIDSKDEIGLLATTFNSMSSQLKNTLDGLERTVTERTKQLETAQEVVSKRAAELQTVAAISTTASRITNVQEMLQTISDLTKDSFNLYHAHIYLFNGDKSELLLTAGAGEVGRKMVSEKRSIPANHPHSLVARVGRTTKGAVVNDVTQEPDFLPNPLLPNTRSEMAIPIVSADEVLGVLDVQGNVLNRFTDEDVAIKTTLAQQVAASLENLRQYEETKSALSQSERLFNASDSLARTTDLQDLVAASVNVLNIPVVNRALLAVFNYDLNGGLEGMDVVANWWQGTGHEATPVGTHYSSEALRVLSIFTSPTPIFFNDMHNDERVDAASQELVKKLKVRSMVGLPLFLGSRQLGMLILEAEEAHNFAQEDIRLFIALAPQIATILENRRQYEQVQKQAKREALLNQIGQQIQGAESVEAVLQITARELGRAIGSKQTRVILKDYV